MHAAARGLQGPIANLARMLAIVDFELRLQPQPDAALTPTSARCERAVAAEFSCARCSEADGDGSSGDGRGSPHPAQASWTARAGGGR